MYFKTKTTIVSVVFATLVSVVPVMGAVTIISTTEGGFNTAKSSSLWNAHVNYAGGTAKELTVNSSTTDHDAWNYHAYDNSPNVITMGFSIGYDKPNSEVTVTLNDVYSTQTDTTYSETSTLIVTTDSFTTLWLGLKSGSPPENNSFSMINATIGGNPIPDFVASGNGYAGGYFAINSDQSFTVVGQLQLDNPQFTPIYGISATANFRVFGDNTLNSIPEPGVAFLVGVSGIFIFLRRRKV